MQTLTDGYAEGRIDNKVYSRFFKKYVTGTCVEVGAARPDWLSIGSLFRLKGWDVISIEPNPVFAEMHRKLGNAVLQYACGDHDEDDVDFSIVNSHGAVYRDGSVSFESWSSLSIKSDYAKLASNLTITNIKVKLRRLDTLFKTYRPDLAKIDILTADVEGWELEVLMGLNFAKFAPRVLIIENLFYKSEYRKFMRDRGYIIWKCCPPNDVYIQLKELNFFELIVCSVNSQLITKTHQIYNKLGMLKRLLRAWRNTKIGNLDK